MKLLFFDSLFPRGHININNNYINLLQSSIEMIICARTGWFECNKNIKYVDANWFYPSEKKCNNFIYRLKVFSNYIKLKKIIKEVNPDIVYVASYDIVSFFLAFPFLYCFRNKIILQEHNNVDQLDNNIKSFLYSFYKNKLNHFVLEDYIKERLIQLNVQRHLIHVVPHPLPKATEFEQDKERLIVGLSNSNDEGVVGRVFKEYKNTNFLRDLKYKLVIKAKKLSYNDEYLRIFNGWITKEEYINYSKNSSFYIIPFSTKGYSYRVSAVLLEAISNRKFILASNFLLAKFYAKKYPGICQIFNEPSEIPSLIKNVNKKQYFESRRLFVADHSDESITKAFIASIRCILSSM